jgi:hypothetical protein
MNLALELNTNIMLQNMKYWYLIHKNVKVI